MFGNYGYGTTSPTPMTNNPFIDQSARTAQRYPDISPSPHLNYGGGQYQQQLPQQQPQQYQQQPYFQQQNPSGINGMYGQSQPQQIQMQPQPTGFQPRSTFGQGLVSGSSYSYLNGNSNSTSPQPQPQQQQQQQNVYANVAQFDPYAAIGSGWDGVGNQSQNQNQQKFGGSMGMGMSSGSNMNGGGGGGYSSTQIMSPIQTTTTSISSSGDPHPREYIRTHKRLIEAWDVITWKGFLELFEKLKGTWENRKKDVEARVGILKNQVGQMQTQVQMYGSSMNMNMMGYGGMGQQVQELMMQIQQYQQEIARVEGLIKEAESNTDSVTASSFQMQEVFQGYRQSGDLASKKRVREATNAALQSLPDWPSHNI